VVERQVGGKWRVVANGIEADGPDAALVAVARAADGAGTYRATTLGINHAPVIYRVPAYGPPLRVDG
jgi:hypothetical protein